MFASLNENGQLIMAEMEPGDVLTAVQAKLDDMNDRYVANSQRDPLPAGWLESSVGRELHRYRRDQGFGFRIRLKYHNCFSCVYNCDGQSWLLSFPLFNDMIFHIFPNMNDVSITYFSFNNQISDNLLQSNCCQVFKPCCFFVLSSFTPFLMTGGNHSTFALWIFETVWKILVPSGVSCWWTCRRLSIG